MPINPDAVGDTSEPVERSWTSKDALLYAVGVGAGYPDPLEEVNTVAAADEYGRSMPRTREERWPTDRFNPRQAPPSAANQFVHVELARQNATATPGKYVHPPRATQGAVR